MSVIIIGAGAAGLMAAKQLSAGGQNVVVVEARNRLGGRIETLNSKTMAQAEAGAEFIHGKLKLTRELLKLGSLKQKKTEGEIIRVAGNWLKEENNFVEGWGTLIERLSKLKKDITVNEFLEEYLPGDEYEETRHSFKKYIHGYDSADINDASAFSVREEMENEQEDQFRVENGYIDLINYIAEQSKKNGCIIETSTIVKQIKWQKNKVEVVADKKTYTAQKVIITVPVGVLQAKEGMEGAIKFTPGIPDHQTEIHNIGFGRAIKILFFFEEAFWLDKEFLKERNIDKPFFFFADTFIPTWWTQYPAKAPLLVGWLAGPDAGKYSLLDEKEFVEKGITSLAVIFKIPALQLRKRLRDFRVCNWVTDPFCRGAYSYATLRTAKAIEFLKKPLEDTIYFSGEAFGLSGTATVDAALQSGEEVAQIVLKK